MRKINSKTTKRWLLASGTALTSIVGSHAASAATLNSSPVVTFTSTTANICTINYTYSATGTSVNDQVTAAATVNGAVVNNGVNGSTVQVANTSTLQTGQTLTLQSSFAITTNFGRAPYAITIYDSVLGNQFVNPLGSAPLSRSMMIAGGPACQALLINSDAVANAGPDQSFNSGGNTVTLNGLGSTDADGDALSYVWTQTLGPGISLSNATAAQPSFTLPAQTNQAKIFEFRLIVNDGIGSNSAPDIVRITQQAGPNTLPVADAGADATITPGATITLSGTANDVDGDPLTYSWTQVSGTSVTISNANSANATFVAPVSNGNAQPLVFGLIVNDGFGNSAQDTVTLTVPANNPPTVNAGPDQSRPAGSTVTLAGSASDIENNPLTYQWTQTAGPAVTLAGATTLAPSFTAPPKTGAAQVLTFSLTANDGISNSTADTVDITIPANAGPVANAGADVTVGGGAQVTLNGSGSIDGDGDMLSYQWTQTAGPAVTLSSNTVANPTFTAPLGGTQTQAITFELRVSDGALAVADSVTVSVNPNAAPVANAGADQGPINTGQTVTLDGTGSTDPDGNAITYLWTQTAGPAVTLSNATAARPTFVAPNVQGTQNLQFQLVVNDGSINSPPDTVAIAVRAVGTITVIQRVTGADTAFTYTSDVTALAGTITTIGGLGQRNATLVPAGAHSLAAADMRQAGYALTSISCNDTDSVVNLGNRSVTIALSPNENLVCTFTSTNTRDAALLAIGNFLTARNAAILASQPDLQRRLTRLEGGATLGGSASAHGVPIPGSGRLPFQLSLGNGQMRASASISMARSALAGESGGRAFDLWAEAYASTLSYPGHKGRFSLLYAGADYRLGDRVLIGGLVQFDRFSHRGALTSGAAEGNGWMAGPYATVKLAPRLYADVRAAWGKSNNQVSPLGTFIDGFDTSRSLYSGSLIGDFALGQDSGIRPEVSVRYLDERSKAYVDSFGVPIPGLKIGQGDISFRPRAWHVFDAGNSWSVRPFIEAEGIYTFGLDSVSVLGSTFRMRAEGGADILSTGGFRFSLSGFYDGIGGSGYSNAGGHLTLSIGM